MASIDSTLKAKLNNYNLVKGSLTQMQRKKTSVVFISILWHVLTSACRGNLSVRSLADIVKKDDFVQDSEYLETLLVAVPK
jgi:V-type H+-transporting ATPase subunit C